MADKAEALITRTLEAAVGERPIVLGGSRACGEALPASDYDLFVVVPLRRVPALMPELARAGGALSTKLGAPATVNPLPLFRWRRPDKNLLVWKLWRDGKILSGADQLAARTPGPAPLTSQTRSSYAVSGLRYLLEHVDPEALGRTGLDRDARRGLRKALLHLAQLDLWARGSHASTLDEALSRAPDGADWAELARAPASAECWLRTRDQLVACVEPACEMRLRGLLVGMQFALLSARRGATLPLREVGRRPSVRHRFWRATTLIAVAVTRDGIDRTLVNQAGLLLPARTPTRADWHQIRAYLEREWPNADPIVGL